MSRTYPPSYSPDSSPSRSSPSSACTTNGADDTDIMFMSTSFESILSNATNDATNAAGILSDQTSTNNELNLRRDWFRAREWSDDVIADFTDNEFNPRRQHGNDNDTSTPRTSPSITRETSDDIIPEITEINADGGAGERGRRPSRLRRMFPFFRRRRRRRTNPASITTVYHPLSPSTANNLNLRSSSSSIHTSPGANLSSLLFPPAPAFIQRESTSSLDLSVSSSSSDTSFGNSDSNSHRMPLPQYELPSNPRATFIQRERINSLDLSVSSSNDTNAGDSHSNVHRINELSHLYDRDPRDVGGSQRERVSSISSSLRRNRFGSVDTDISVHSLDLSISSSSNASAGDSHSNGHISGSLIRRDSFGSIDSDLSILRSTDDRAFHHTPLFRRRRRHSYRRERYSSVSSFGGGPSPSVPFGNASKNRGADIKTINSLPYFTIVDVEGQLPPDRRSCSICLEDYCVGEARKTLPCMHGFHKGCADKWLGMNGWCPICKHQIKLLE